MRTFDDLVSDADRADVTGGASTTPHALIALAMLSLGGHRTVLPGRI